MSGFDPLAALAADVAAVSQGAAAIDLGVSIEILQAQLAVGDLLIATILPPQGGSDRLSMLGQTVLAQLPPGIDPGASLLLQITGFSGTQILVRNLGVVDPANPPPVVNVELPPPAPGTPQQAVLTTQSLPNAAPPASVGPPSSLYVASSVRSPQAVSGTEPPPTPAPASSPPPAPPQASPGPVAPPRAVFVAASVQQNRAIGAQGATQAELLRPQTIPDELGLEARIAATRAASIDLSELVAEAPPSPQPPQQQRQAPLPAQPVPVSARAESASWTAPRPIPVQPQPAAPQSAEEALLARLRVPLSAVTLAAAKVANNAAALLPRALARLDAALARVAQPDAQVATLRTALGFLQRIDPSNARALPEQLAAYVAHVVDGSEAKLAALVRALAGAVTHTPVRKESSLPPQGVRAATSIVPAEEEATMRAASDAPRNDLELLENVRGSSALVQAEEARAAQLAPADINAPVRPAPAPQAVSPPNAFQPQAPVSVTSSPAEPLPPAVAAHVAERTVALQYDAKAAIVSLSESPPHDAPAALGPALSETLTAMTGVQLNVLNAQRADPSAIAIPLPVFYHDAGRPVQMRISRDAPHGGKMDADNFHIAFVLDTKSLGVVAVDIQTAGRAVSVNVKTEGASAAQRFRTTLDDLRDRLEQLRYRVASMAAGVAPHRAPLGGAGSAEISAGTLEEPAKPSRLDLQA